ncbi:hypothetical protein ACFQ7J_30470 [Streptomyces sp. NPDC056501]|uniref:hypothetical protein n=1 Tax=Streptomyces sp. NPDC056501 TaxID=3345841 RepID=UPI0036C13133
MTPENLVRPLADANNVNLRAAATAAWWALERDPARVLPSLHGLLDTYRNCEAADVLALIGPPAASALPRLTELLTTGDIRTRLHAAKAVWDIAGQPEADNVVQTLLDVWEKNEATTRRIVPFLDRIGPAARHRPSPASRQNSRTPAAGPALPSAKTCTTPAAPSTAASPALEADRRRSSRSRPGGDALDGAGDGVRDHAALSRSLVRVSWQARAMAYRPSMSPTTACPRPRRSPALRSLTARPSSASRAAGRGPRPDRRRTPWRLVAAA